MIQEAVLAKLAATSALTALVSTRIYNGTAPQGVGLPYVVFSEISSDRPRSMSGAVAIVDSRVEVLAYGASPDSSIAVADAVRGALDGYRGTSSGVSVRSCRLESTDDDYVRPRSGESIHIYRRSLEFAIWYIED